MRIALLADRSSIHTVRWANALAERGYELHVLSMHRGGDALDERVQTHPLPFSAPWGYYANALTVRRLLRNIRPEVLHAHFASGYGTLGRLSDYRPYILSVWGSDVYHFPCKSSIHRRVLTANLRAAGHIVSISHAMAQQTRSLYPRADISVVPWGIDPSQFCSSKEPSRTSELVVGTVKALHKTYGIDILIDAFAKARQQLALDDEAVASRLRLLIVGGGADREQLEAQVSALGLGDVTTFAGRIPHAEVPAYLNCLDIYVATSRRESFGVAVVEASACERPVVVSDVGGLPEVVENGVTGYIVECENAEVTAEALLELINDPLQRHRMGRAGRQRALERYTWVSNVTDMEAVYQRVLEGT